MVFSAGSELGDLGRTIQTIVLAGIFIYELFGPVLVKYILTKIGETHDKDVACDETITPVEAK